MKLKSIVYPIFQKLRLRWLRILLNNPSKYRLVVNIVTTWNIKCGVAAHSRYLANSFRKVKVKITRIHKPFSSNPIYFFTLGWKASREHEIVHVQFEYSMFGKLNFFRYDFPGWGALFFYLSILLFGKACIVTTLHEAKPLKGGRYFWKRYLTKFVCSISDIIIVHNQICKETLVRYYGIKKKIVVIPHGSYETPIVLDKNSCKQKLGLFGKRVIVIPGYVHRDKGHDILLDVFPSLDSDICLLVAGGPRIKERDPYYEELKAKTHKLNLEKRVVFYGFVPEQEFPLVLNASDIAVLPYRHSTGSGILPFLVSYKVPTITSDLESFKEIKKKYDCVELFERNNIFKLHEKISALLKDVRRRSELATNCEKMHRETSWSTVAKKHEDIYSELLVHHSDALYNEERQMERLEWLRKKKNGRTLEIGCATGLVMEYCDAEVGLDTNKFRVIFAKTRIPSKEFVVASALNLPFQAQVFDTIMIPEVLEHLPFNEAMKVVAESRRVGRKLLVTVPNAEKPDYDVALVKNPEHKWYPTVADVYKLLGNEIEIEYTNKGDFILIESNSVYKHEQLII